MCLLKSEMSDSDRHSLFEGIIIGIYGNWLISLIEMISFTEPLVIGTLSLVWFQPFLIILSILCLIALVAIGIYGGKLETHWEVILLAIGHFTPISISLYVEGLIIQDIFFLAIGAPLFSMIYVVEYMRAKRAEKTRIKK